MIDNVKVRRSEALTHALAGVAPPAAETLAARIVEKHPDSAVILYGSGASLLSNVDPESVLYDFYVIAPSYRAAYASAAMRLMNRLIPPNVFYFETTDDGVRLRAKYAVLSIGHFEKLVGAGTFHSYFWARFAQPCRIISASPEMRRRIEACVATAIDVFVRRAAPLAGEDATIRDIWRVGLEHSYKSELRAESPDRVVSLLESYGDWPEQITPKTAVEHAAKNRALSEIAWRIRTIQGGALSAIRLLKGIATFKGGIDYIAWKISRHAGFTLPVKEWERRHPFPGTFSLARRYYRMRRKLNP